MPPEKLIWDGTSDELSEWIDNIMNTKKQDNFIMINPAEIE